MQDELTLVALGQQYRIEGDRPDAIIRLLDADVLMGERVCNIQEFVAEREPPARRDLLDEDVRRVLEGWYAGWERTRDRPVVRSRHLAVEVDLQPLLAVLAPERIKRGEMRSGRPNGAALRRAMHALMRAVLLRKVGMSPLVLNVQPHPPDVEIRGSVDHQRGEKDAVVGASRARRPYSRMARSKTGRASTPCVERTP